MSTRRVTEAFAQQVSDELRSRYELDDEDIRALGAKLVGDHATRNQKNVDFANCFTEEHGGTFDRLSQ